MLAGSHWEEKRDTSRSLEMTDGSHSTNTQFLSMFHYLQSIYIRVFRLSITFTHMQKTLVINRILNDNLEAALLDMKRCARPSMENGPFLNTIIHPRATNSHHTTRCSRCMVTMTTYPYMLYQPAFYQYMSIVRMPIWGLRSS